MSKQEVNWTIVPQFYGYVDPSTILILYLTLVHPHLEYACQVWNPHTKRNIDLLENVQKFTFRMSYKQWTSNYSDLLYLSNISTLGERRLYLSLTIMYKITHSLVYFPSEIFLPKQPGRLRSSNSLNAYYVNLFQNKCISQLVCAFCTFGTYSLQIS